MKYGWGPLVIGAYVAVLGACRDSDGSGAPPFMTGLDRNRALTSFNAQEKLQLCQELEDWFVANYDAETTERSFCIIDSFDDYSVTTDHQVDVDVAACHAAVSTCIAEDRASPLDFECDQNLDMTFTSCSATLGVYVDCLGALMGGPTFTCETIEMWINESLDRDPDAPLPIEEVAECMPYLRACPDAIQRP
jgi:hypothetical protein